MNASVLIAGSTNLDRTLQVNALPNEGETIFAAGYAEALGGKGANQAIACALTGTPTVFVTCLGGGETAELLRHSLAAQPMTCLFDGAAGAAEAGQAWIHVDQRGSNFITVLAGANSLLSGAFIETALRADGRAISHLVLQGESAIATIEEAILAARRLGIAPVLNLAPPVVIDPQVLRLVDTLIVNEHEAAQLARAIAVEGGDLAALHAYLGVQRLVVTLGASGAVLHSHSEQPVLVSAQLVDAIDTAGAGDALVGVFAGCLATGMSPAAALTQAVNAASDSTLRSGASTSYSAETFRIPHD